MPQREASNWQEARKRTKAEMETEKGEKLVKQRERERKEGKPRTSNQTENKPSVKEPHTNVDRHHVHRSHLLILPPQTPFIPLTSSSESTTMMLFWVQIPSYPGLLVGRSCSMNAERIERKWYYCVHFTLPKPDFKIKSDQGNLLLFFTSFSPHTRPPINVIALCVEERRKSVSLNEQIGF